MHCNACGIKGELTPDIESIAALGRCTYCEKHGIEPQQFIGMTDLEGNELKVGDTLESKDGTLWQVAWDEKWGAYTLANDRGQQPIDNYVQHMRRLW